MRYDFGKKELELVVNELREVFEVILDRAMEDEREEDPDGVDLSTDEYDGGEDKAELADNATELVEKLADEAIDKGIARFECPIERNRLVKGLGGARATT